MSMEFMVTASGYGYNTRQPFVTIEFKGERIQVSPETAKELALNILSASEAAMSDAFLVEWAWEVLDVGDAQAAALLAEFRVWRGKRRDKMEGEDV